MCLGLGEVCLGLGEVYLGVARREEGELRLSLLMMGEADSPLEGLLPTITPRLPAPGPEHLLPALLVGEGDLFLLLLDLLPLLPGDLWLRDLLLPDLFLGEGCGLCGL